MGNFRNAILKSGICFTFCNVLQKGALIFSVPIFTRLMSTEDYGMTATYQSWNSILIILVSLALYMGVFNNGMTFFEEDRDCFVSALQGLSTTIAIITLLVVLIFRNQISNTLGMPQSIVVCMFLSYIFLPAFEYWNSRIKFEYRYRPLLIATFVYSAITIIIPLVVVLNTKEKGEAKILSQIVALTLFSIFFYFWNFQKGKKFFVWKYWKYVLLFNLPLIPHYLSNILLGQSDRIMIAKMCGNSQAGIYSVAGSLHGGVAVVVSAINSAFIPWLYNELKADKFCEIHKKAEQLIILMGTFVFGIVSCTPEIIHILAAKEYYEAIYVVPSILMGSFFSLLYMFAGNIEVFYGKRIFMTCATAFSALLNIFLNYILIPKYGYLVCGYTTLFCEFIYAGAHFMFMCNIRVKGTKLIHHQIYNIRKIIGICGTVGIGVIIQGILYNTIVLRYFLLIAVCGIIGIIFMRKEKRKA